MSFINNIIQHPVLVAYLTGANNYTWLHFRDGKKLLVSKSLSYFEGRLPKFIRIHKTAMINPQCMQAVYEPPRRKASGVVEMSCGTKLPIGRRRWNEIAETLLQSIAKTEKLESANYRSVVFVTNDDVKGFLLQQAIESQFPDCLVHLVAKGAHLPELLRTTPDYEMPVLILLDARSSLNDRLNTLHLLKNKSHTAKLPTILLVSKDADDEVYQGYVEQANSVVAISDFNEAFVQTVGQLSRYWLTFSALPMLNT